MINPTSGPHDVFAADFTSGVTLDVPTPAQADRIVATARRRFQRVLPQWASDVLWLRQSGRLFVRWQDADRDDGMMDLAA